MIGTCYILPGAYLSHNNKFINPNTTIILISDIGTSSTPDELICTSSRKPCCHKDIGGWYFINGSRVHEIADQSLPPMTFRERKSEGNISLYRVNDDVIAPTGQFCCKVTDDTDTNHTLCVHVCKWQSWDRKWELMMYFFNSYSSFTQSEYF